MSVRHDCATRVSRPGSRSHAQNRTHQTAPPVVHRRPADDDNTLTDLDILEAILASPDIPALAAALPTIKSGGRGRPSTYPDVVFIIFVVLAGSSMSHRGAARMMRNDRYWPLIRQTAQKYTDKMIPRIGPSRAQCEYRRHQMDVHVDALCQVFAVEAMKLANELGCLTADGPSTINRPRRSGFVIADGVVIASPFSKAVAEERKTAGETIASDPFKQGGEDSKSWAYGSKFWMASTRPDNTPNLQVILDVRSVPHGKKSPGDEEYGGEAAVGVRGLAAIAKAAQSITGVNYDGALRGVHIDALMKLGLIVFSPPHKGTTKTRPITEIACPCGDKHGLYTAAGALHERTVIADGSIEDVPCPTSRLARRANSDGTFRWYIEFAIPSCGTIHRQRIDISGADRKRDNNRAEHLRQFAPNTTVYTACYGWREDSESINATLKRALPGKEGHMTSHTAPRQHVTLLGFAVSRNALARHLAARQSSGGATQAA